MTETELGRWMEQAGDRLGCFSGRCLHYGEVASTNDVAARLAEHGAVEGTVVVADAQSAGRGRRGNEWASPAGAGLYVSAILRPTPRALPLLTLAAGVAIAEGVAAAAGLECDLKWPNDVYAGGRKLAGVLAERGSTGTDSHVVVGMGINVNAVSYPPAVAARATNIEAELGHPVDRAAVLTECLAALWSGYAALQAGDAARVLDAWRGRAARTLRRRVEWTGERGDTQRGIAEDIDDGGALLVSTAGGAVRVISGVVTWL